ncbi:MAG TPA: lipopolysaccharide kinase InaA family protein, partial [Methylophilaceae bacterium]|nr:lipopolysaccharide kinase InaA family protein [Methylophilaceae bacterium]
TRDGEKLKAAPDLATESPLYLQWPLNRVVSVKPSATSLKDLSIHRHAEREHTLFRQNGWQGLLLARDDKEDAALHAALNPEHIGTQPRDALLRNARNAIWTILDPCDAARKLVVKQPVKVRSYKKLLGRFRPSKALRSWNGASELLRRGIETARPVAYFEKIDDTSLTQNYYICEYIKADFSVRKIFSAFAAGNEVYQGVTEEDAYRQLCDYLCTMHNRGIYFRDLSGGNILIRKSEGNTLNFSLIDTGRVHFFNHGTPLSKRISDLTRVCNKLHAAGRDRFMSMYMGRLGRHFGFWQRLPFYLYNTKVILKRRLKRKNLIKLFMQRDIDNR